MHGVIQELGPAAERAQKKKEEEKCPSPFLSVLSCRRSQKGSLRPRAVPVNAGTAAPREDRDTFVYPCWDGDKV